MRRILDPDPPCLHILARSRFEDSEVVDSDQRPRVPSLPRSHAHLLRSVAPGLDDDLSGFESCLLRTDVTPAYSSSQGASSPSLSSRRYRSLEHAVFITTPNCPLQLQKRTLSLPICPIPYSHGCAFDKRRDPVHHRESRKPHVVGNRQFHPPSTQSGRRHQCPTEFSCAAASGTDWSFLLHAGGFHCFGGYSSRPDAKIMQSPHQHRSGLHSRILHRRVYPSVSTNIAPRPDTIRMVTGHRSQYLLYFSS